MYTTIPFDISFIAQLARAYPTPLYIYDEARIRWHARTLAESMQAAGVPGFRNYFAVKALPNPHILKLLVGEGMGMDCSSVAELELAAQIGLRGDDIMFTSNNTTPQEFRRALELDAIINFDDLSLVGPCLRQCGIPRVACCRYNPGDISFEGANEQLIGRPSEAKYGMPKAQIIEAYRQLQTAGVNTFGLHTMLLSNDLNYHDHVRIAQMLLELAHQIHQELGIVFSFINLGGGMGVAYRPSEQDFDVATYALELAKLYNAPHMQAIDSPRIVSENGRWVTADAGYLVTKVVNRKDTHKTYIGVDATMANLMRPGMYGAYHQVSVLGREHDPATITADVVGSLCENNDKFAIDRKLPPVQIGDYVVIHTVGAHSHAMGFQYNGKLRSAEVLLRLDGSTALIRRAETLDDYFATLHGPGVDTV